MKKNLLFLSITFLFIFHGNAQKTNFNISDSKYNLSVFKAFSESKPDFEKFKPEESQVPNFGKMIPLSGTYSVGLGASDDYQSLFLALQDIQTNGVSGPVTLELSVDFNAGSEVYPILLQDFTGSSELNTLTIKPADGVSITIDNAATSEGTSVFTFLDASNIIIDGSNNGTDTRDLTIVNSGAFNQTAPVALFTDVTPGNNITIVNCVLKAISKDYETAGIYSNLYTNVNIVNNEIKSCDVAVMIEGGENINVIDNITGSDLDTDYINLGIGMSQVNSYNIIGNTVKNIYSNSVDAVHGIFSYMGSGNIVVSKNILSKIVHIGNNTSQGMAFYMLTADNLKINNNHISGIASDSYTDNYPAGISIYCPDMTSGIKINYNTISMEEDNTYGAGTGDTDVFITGISIGGGTGIIMKNNIISNTMGEKDGSTQSTYGVAMLTNLIPSPFIQISNNIYYSAGDFDYTYLAMTSEGPKNLADWQTFTSGDADSYFEDPLFVAADNLNLQACSPAITQGTPLNGILEDITGFTRHTTNPTIGAYEYEMIQASELVQMFPAKETGFVTLGWTPGSGCKSAVFMKEGDFLAEPPQPVNGTTYIANDTIGFGDEIGTSGWFCVYNSDSGTGYNEQLFTGVNGVTYTVKVCEYWGIEGDEFYMTDTAVNNPILVIGDNSGSVNEISDNISIYPNPTLGKLTINSEQLSINKISIFDITGKTIYNSSFITNNSTIDLSNYVTGIYFIRIQTKTGVAVKKIIKE